MYVLKTIRHCGNLATIAAQGHPLSHASNAEWLQYDRQPRNNRSVGVAPPSALATVKHHPHLAKTPVFPSLHAMQSERRQYLSVLTAPHHPPAANHMPPPAANHMCLLCFTGVCTDVRVCFDASDTHWYALVRIGRCRLTSAILISKCGSLPATRLSWSRVLTVRGWEPCPKPPYQPTDQTSKQNNQPTSSPHEVGSLLPSISHRSSRFSGDVCGVDANVGF